MEKSEESQLKVARPQVPVSRRQATSRPSKFLAARTWTLAFFRYDMKEDLSRPQFIADIGLR